MHIDGPNLLSGNEGITLFPYAILSFTFYLLAYIVLRCFYILYIVISFQRAHLRENKFFSLHPSPPSSFSPSPAVVDKERRGFRRGTWRLSCSVVWVIRHERCNNLGATRDLGALTWSRLNYGRSWPAVRYVTYLRLSITLGGVNTRPGLSRLDARERGWISVSTEARIYERF